MPPSGFNQKAINGLLEFVKATYEQTQSLREQYNTEQELLEARILDMNRAVATVGESLSIPDSGVLGLATFVTENYRDLIREIETGKKPYDRAVAKEIDDIGEYLGRFEL